MPTITLNLVELLSSHYQKTQVLLPGTIELDLNDLLTAHRMVGVIWQISDVKVCRWDLSDEQCWEVLQHAQRECDGEHGITWDTLHAAAYTLFTTETKE